MDKVVNTLNSVPDIKGEMDEIKRVSQQITRNDNFPVSVKEVKKSFKGVEAVELTKEIWDKLENTESNTIEEGEFEKAIHIASMYGKSNPYKLRLKLMEDTYKRPLIVKFNDRYHLVSGNTRLCVSAAIGFTPMVFIGDLNQNVESKDVEGLNESKNLSTIQTLINNGVQKIQDYAFDMGLGEMDELDEISSVDRIDVISFTNDEVPIVNVNLYVNSARIDYDNFIAELEVSIGRYIPNVQIIISDIIGDSIEKDVEGLNESLQRFRKPDKKPSSQLSDVEKKTLSYLWDRNGLDSNKSKYIRGSVEDINQHKVDYIGGIQVIIDKINETASETGIHEFFCGGYDLIFRIKSLEVKEYITINVEIDSGSNVSLLDGTLHDLGDIFNVSDYMEENQLWEIETEVGDCIKEYLQPKISSFGFNDEGFVELMFNVLPLN